MISKYRETLLLLLVVFSNSVFAHEKTIDVQTSESSSS